MSTTLPDIDKFAQDWQAKNAPAPTSDRGLPDVDAFAQQWQAKGAPVQAPATTPEAPPAMQNTPPPSAKQSPKQGDVVKGYKFQGGDPSQQKNWKKA